MVLTRRLLNEPKFRADILYAQYVCHKKKNATKISYRTIILRIESYAEVLIKRFRESHTHRNIKVYV